MASEYDDEDDWVDDWEYDGEAEEPPRNRLAEALTVFGLTFPLALLFVTVLAIVGIGLVVAVVYVMMWFLITALGSGPNG